MYRALLESSYPDVCYAMMACVHPSSQSLSRRLAPGVLFCHRLSLPDFYCRIAQLDDGRDGLHFVRHAKRDVQIPEQNKLLYSEAPTTKQINRMQIFDGTTVLSSRTTLPKCLTRLSSRKDELDRERSMIVTATPPPALHTQRRTARK
jgi:hypothetical protein